MLLLICPVALLEAYQLPDTGQTYCFQGWVPWASIPCEGTGEDGEYSINPMNFTDNGNGTVTDNNTGLVWQKQDDGTVYNWYQASGVYDGSYNPPSTNVCGSLNLGGYSDWRLPTKKELITLVDYSVSINSGPLINSIFTNAKTSYYWSSTTSAYAPGAAWVVDFADGRIYPYNYPGNNNNYVRCVRGEEVQSVFVDNNDGTVTDNSTGLVWQRDEPGEMSWWPALAYCEGLSLGGSTDWRLPNIKELESLTDSTRYNPAIDITHFPNVDVSNVDACYYWSSTNFSWPAKAYFVTFCFGVVWDEDKPDPLNVRCVRGGKVDISPLSKDFGMINVGSTSPSQTFTVSNARTADLIVTSMSFIGGDSAMFSLKPGGTNPCPSLAPTIAAGASCTVVVGFTPSSEGAKFTSFRTVSNASNNPTLDVALTGTGTLQPVFNDTPEDSFAEDFINTMSYHGITGGCGNGNFCPDSPITRGQMAVFIETSLGHPANNCTGRFVDVPVGNPYCGFIERMADDGITGGCGEGIFCPNSPVTRGQMSVFIEAALGHTSTTCTGQFTDVPVGHPFCRFIEHLASDGITSGCGGGKYCPDAPVTRAQMAVFLVAAPPPLNP